MRSVSLFTKLFLKDKRLGKTSLETIQIVIFVLADLRRQKHWIILSECNLRLQVTENYCLENFEQDFRNYSCVCGDWHLHYDNAPAHSSNLVQQFLSNPSIALLRQPLYSPDIAPCDFWLFLKLKKPLNGQRFSDKMTVWRSGNIAGTVLFNQVGITLEDATRPMMKNKASAEI